LVVAGASQGALSSSPSFCGVVCYLKSQIGCADLVILLQAQILM
jgi:hypothetical protein